MERKSGPIVLRDSVVAIAVSFLFFYLGFAQFFFVFPLLLLSTQLGKGVSLISIAVETALVVLYVVLTSSGGALALPFALFELYIPLSLLAAGVIWLMTEKKSAGLRLLFSILPSALFFIILYVYLEQDPALLENIIGVYEDAFEALLGGGQRDGASPAQFSRQANPGYGSTQGYGSSKESYTRNEARNVPPQMPLSDGPEDFQDDDIPF